MLYAIICSDKPESLAIRMSVRPDHLAYLKQLGDALKMAGPFTDANDQANGSLLIIEAENREAVMNVVADDPYAKAELFSRVEIRPWKWLINNPEV